MTWLTSGRGRGDLVSKRFCPKAEYRFLNFFNFSWYFEVFTAKRWVPPPFDKSGQGLGGRGGVEKCKSNLWTFTFQAFYRSLLLRYMRKTSTFPTVSEYIICISEFEVFEKVSIRSPFRSRLPIHVQCSPKLYDPDFPLPKINKKLANTRNFKCCSNR